MLCPQCAHTVPMVCNFAAHFHHPRLRRHHRHQQHNNPARLPLHPHPDPTLPDPTRPDPAAPQPLRIKLPSLLQGLLAKLESNSFLVKPFKGQNDVARMQASGCPWPKGN